MALKKIAAVALALTGIGMILWIDGRFMQNTDMLERSRNMGYGLLFLAGLLTSFHCVGMCGPLIVGYTAKHASQGGRSYGSHLLYGAGKTLSYSAIGALFGAFGSFIAFTPQTQSAVGIAAGIFLILFGLHLLNVFPALRHFQLKTPACVMRFVGKQYRKQHNPFVIGLLNGLMIICGPLQAMYVMAAGTGSWLEGASLLFFFGLGALPLMLGFGFLTSLLSTNLTPKLLKASGVIVMALGAIMLNRGLRISGSALDFDALAARVSEQPSPIIAEKPSLAAEQTITTDVQQSSFTPKQFILRKGVPVKWEINGQGLNACNQGIVVPKYGIEVKLHPGVQTIEFTPQESGVVAWSCGMGMLAGTFIVVDDPVNPEQEEAGLVAAGQERPAAETFGHRLTREAKQLWRRLVSLCQRTSS